jgi:hypothetical protein
LTEVDHRTRARAEPLHDLTLMTVLLLEPMREVVDGSRDRALAALDFAEPVFARLAVPRRMADGICRIAAVMPKLTARKPARFARTEQYRLAMDVLSLSEAWQERCE